MTVPLPESGDGSRRQRRADRRRTGRRSAVRLLAIAALVAVVGWIAWFAVGLTDGDDEDPAAGDALREVVTDAPDPALVLLSDDAGDVYGITILAPSTSTIVHVPPGTLVEVASIGLAALREAGIDDSGDLLRNSLENLVGVRFGEVLHLGPAELASLVQSAGSLSVTVDEPVEERESTGRVTVLVPSGSYTILPENAVAFLSVVGDGTSLDRVVRHQLFWTAYLGAARDAPVDALAAMAGRELRQRVLPVEAVAGIEGDDELYRVIDDDVADLVDRVFPHAASADGDRIRVRILNGAGVPGIAQQVQPLLIDIGAQVTLSGNADRFDYATTQIVYTDDARLEDARAIREALGVGEVVKSLNELAVVDVTVVVGTDFLAAYPEDS